MITTHLVLFEFLTGASGAAAVDGIDSQTSVPPLLFFDGFSGGAAIDGIDSQTSVPPLLFFDGFSGTVVVASDARQLTLTGVGV